MFFSALLPHANSRSPGVVVHSAIKYFRSSLSRHTVLKKEFINRVHYGWVTPVVTFLK